MNENEKRRFDAIWELCKSSWQRISERRVYEWRVNFTLWTTFAAFIAIVVTRTLPVQQIYLFWGVVAIGAALSVIHWRWLKRLNDATWSDNCIAIHYEEILRELSSSGFDKDLKKDLHQIREKQKSLWRNGARLSGLFITIVLYIATILVAWPTTVS